MKNIILLVFFIALGGNLQAQQPNAYDRRIANIWTDSDSKRIIGGHYFNLQQTPVVYVLTADSECTGTLVGSNLVLTAAHCLEGHNFFAVFAGAKDYDVKAAYMHPYYKANQSLSEQLNFDIGILVLDEDVKGLNPVPVIYDWPLNTGDNARVMGYGLVESANDNPFLRSKYADLRLDKVHPEYVTTAYQSSGASTCVGDSGGPLLQYIYEYAVIIGVVSQGNTGHSNNACKLGGGITRFTNIQSVYSQGFISLFPNLFWISGRKLLVYSTTEFIVSQSVDVATNKRGAMLKYLRKARRSLLLLKGIAKDQQLSLINKAIRQARIPVNKKLNKRQVFKKYNQLISTFGEIMAVDIA